LNFSIPSHKCSPESVMIHSSPTISDIGEVSIGFRVSIRTFSAYFRIESCTVARDCSSAAVHHRRWVHRSSLRWPFRGGIAAIRFLVKSWCQIT
jgi:hypothetical protein